MVSSCCFNTGLKQTVVLPPSNSPSGYDLRVGTIFECKSTFTCAGMKLSFVCPTPVSINKLLALRAPKLKPLIRLAGANRPAAAQA